MSGLPCQYKKYIHVTEVTNYEVTSVTDMCVLCGIPYMTGQAGPTFNPNTHQIYEMINSVIKDADIKAGKIVAQPLKGCPVCGQTLEEIAMSGKIGCSHCYEFYKKDLLPLIKKCQSATKHIGKTPKQSKSTLIKKLETELKEAIAAENYVRAASLRDEINKLREQ
jgi:protein arginine kinase activator